MIIVFAKVEFDIAAMAKAVVKAVAYVVAMAVSIALISWGMYELAIWAIPPS